MLILQIRNQKVKLLILVNKPTELFKFRLDQNIRCSSHTDKNTD